MRITVHGSYGTGNRGDNVILTQLLRFLGQECPGASVTILCRNVRRVSIFLAEEFPDTPLQIQPLHASFRRRPLRVLRACTSCDVFILGGGGLLWGGVPGNLSYWLLRPRLAKLAGRRVVFYVPGIYGIRGRAGLRLLGKVARSADFLSVRDQEGLDQLVRAGIPPERVVLGADPAFLLSPPENDRVENLLDALGLRGRRLVGLSARDWRSRLSAGIFAKFVRSLLEDESAVLIFFVLKTGGVLGETDTDDISVVARLLGTLTEETRERVIIVDENYSIREVTALMAACEFVVGMRLHSLIFATIAGTPYGAVAYDEKIAAYMRMLGREELLLDMSEVAVPDRLLEVAAALREERARSGESGPIPAILQSADQLSVRSLTMHRELAGKLGDWFPREEPQPEVGDAGDPS